MERLKSEEVLVGKRKEGRRSKVVLMVWAVDNWGSRETREKYTELNNQCEVFAKRECVDLLTD